jgi:IS5 family transposase
VKVSFVTTNRRCKGGQFVLHAMALPGKPHDGHTGVNAGTVITGLTTGTGGTGT